MSGLEVLHAIQTLHTPGLTVFFRLMTDLHETTAYVLFFPLIVWFFDKRWARYLLHVLLLGLWSNGALKYGLDTGRPSPADVVVLYPETGIGPAFPSGHAQNPLMFWGAFALKMNRGWLTLLLGALVFMIGFSRLYAGLHWPIDLLGGWAIGAILLAGFEATRSFWVGDRMSFRVKLALASIIPLGTLFLSWWSPRWNVPSEVAGESWVMAGAYLGFWAGSILEEEFVDFDPRRGGLAAQLMKLAVGLLLVMGVRYGLKAAFPAIAMWDAVRYFFVAITASLVAPWIFQHYIVAPPADHSVAG